ncbi:hypothetical protein [Acidihalobacter prosperus]
MATPIAYTPTPQEPDCQDEANQALEQLTRLLHKRGILRLANNLLDAGPELTVQLAELADQDKNRETILNLTRLLTLLGKLDGDLVENLVKALSSGLAAFEQNPSRQSPETTMMTTLIPLMRDREFWDAINRLADFLKAFNRELKT